MSVQGVSTLKEKSDYWLTDDGFAELTELAARARAEADATKPVDADDLRRWQCSEQAGAADRFEGALRAVQRERQADALAESLRSGPLPSELAAVVDRVGVRPPTRQSVENSVGGWTTETVIGSVVVTQPFECDQRYETAAWYTRHRVEPGVYDVTLSDHGMVTVAYDTTIVDERFPVLLCGVAIPGGRDAKPKVGKRGRHHAVSRTFELPSSYAPGVPAFGGALVLRRGVELHRDTVESSSRLAYTTRFTMPDDVEVLPDVYHPNRQRR